MGWISAGIGLVSAIMGKKSADKAAKQSMTGFNYLKDNTVVNEAQTAGAEAGTTANALLGIGDQEAQDAAFEKYKGSTGYETRMEAGQDAITGNNAAKGLLNSGATAKGLTKFGQEFGSNEFSKYLGQLQGVQAQGLNAAYNTASQGTTGGANAAGYTQQGTKDVVSGLGMAAGGLTDVAQQAGWIN